VRTQGLLVQMRVGLTAARSWCGPLAMTCTWDYSAVGQTTIWPARMEQLAAAGQHFAHGGDAAAGGGLGAGAGAGARARQRPGGAGGGF